MRCDNPHCPTSPTTMWRERPFSWPSITFWAPWKMCCPHSPRVSCEEDSRWWVMWFVQGWRITSEPDSVWLQSPSYLSCPTWEHNIQIQVTFAKCQRHSTHHAKCLLICPQTLRWYVIPVFMDGLQGFERWELWYFLTSWFCDILLQFPWICMKTQVMVVSDSNWKIQVPVKGSLSLRFFIFKFFKFSKLKKKKFFRDKLSLCCSG